MFQFRRFPSYTYFIQHMMTEVCSAGLLHSEICGSMCTYHSPQLIAVNHVLHRLPMPRHSPCALISFTICFMFLSSLKKLLISQYHCSFYLPDNFLSLKLVVSSFAYFTFFVIQFSRSNKEMFPSLMGTSGLEPPTSRLSGVRSNHLSYAPVWWR